MRSIKLAHSVAEICTECDCDIEPTHSRYVCPQCGYDGPTCSACLWLEMQEYHKCDTCNNGSNWREDVEK